MKKAGDVRIPSMSCKAFNGRVVLEYLAASSRLAASRTAAAGANRLLGRWLMGNALQHGHSVFPDNPLIPLQAAALLLAPLKIVLFGGFRFWLCLTSKFVAKVFFVMLV